MNPYNNSHFKFVNKSFPRVEFSCTEMLIPSISMEATPQISRFSDTKHPGDKLVFSPLSLTFLVDEDLLNYVEISDWLMRIRDTEYEKIDEAISDSKILIHNSSHKLIGTYTFKDSFPTNLGSLELTSTDAGIIFPTATVDFDYTSFHFERAK